MTQISASLHLPVRSYECGEKKQKHNTHSQAHLLLEGGAQGPESLAGAVSRRRGGGGGGGGETVTLCE